MARPHTMLLQSVLHCRPTPNELFVWGGGEGMSKALNPFLCL